ncbi:MAG: lysophospholipid acyltransferase family protein [Proteobacteria bacterium]|nr:lysophospholipid acyltransferase family protein [Pseudomonadota bacterium]
MNAGNDSIPAGPLAYLRAGLFNLGFFAWTAAVCLFLWPAIPMGRKAMIRCADLWSRGVFALLAGTVGLRHRIEGLDNLPERPAILASKHQSAWDTIAFYRILEADPVYVLKRELTWIPILGWYLRRIGMVPVDRKGGAAALRRMTAAARAILAQGRRIVIFPEGTRTAPGTRRPYHPGIAALYIASDMPVVPVALNSGQFWPRRGFLKRPGTITLRILPPIQPGLDRRAFVAELEGRIEEACAALTATPGENSMRNSVNNRDKSDCSV